MKSRVFTKQYSGNHKIDGEMRHLQDDIISFLKEHAFYNPILPPAQHMEFYYVDEKLTYSKVKVIRRNFSISPVNPQPYERVVEIETMPFNSESSLVEILKQKGFKENNQSQKNFSLAER